MANTRAGGAGWHPATRELSLPAAAQPETGASPRLRRGDSGRLTSHAPRPTPTTTTTLPSPAPAHCRRHEDGGLSGADTGPVDLVVLLVETGADDKSKDIEVTMTLFQKIEKELEGERKKATWKSIVKKRCRPQPMTGLLFSEYDKKKADTQDARKHRAPSMPLPNSAGMGTSFQLVLNKETGEGGRGQSMGVVQFSLEELVNASTRRKEFTLKSSARGGGGGRRASLADIDSATSASKGKVVICLPPPSVSRRHGRPRGSPDQMFFEQLVEATGAAGGRGANGAGEHDTESSPVVPGLRINTKVFPEDLLEEKPQSHPNFSMKRRNSVAHIGEGMGKMAGRRHSAGTGFEQRRSMDGGGAAKSGGPLPHMARRASTTGMVTKTVSERRRNSLENSGMGGANPMMQRTARRGSLASGMGEHDNSPMMRTFSRGRRHSNEGPGGGLRPW